ncbi:MAG TPA: PAS domain S-box protein [Candidatus Limnocylindria bacterium]|nr:PAS domain S-box protein [Candidatus Limnocylindria bacterium]
MTGTHRGGASAFRRRLALSNPFSQPLSHPPHSDLSKAPPRGGRFERGPDRPANDTEQALRSIEERFRSLVEQSSEAIFILDVEGRVVEVNASGATLLGYSMEELVGRAWVDLVAPADLAAQPLHFSELRAGKALVFARQLQHSNGSTVPVELSARMQSDGRLVHVARDNSERVRAETERASLLATLSESRRDLEEAQRIAHVGSWTLEPASGSATWSAEMYRILGRDPAGPAVELGDIAKLFTPDSVALVTAAVQRAVETGEPWQVELETVRPDGARGWVTSVGVVEQGENGAVTKIRGTMQDVTDRRQLEAQLQQAQRLEAVGQLAGGIAHDFNNLLTAIRGYTELIRANLGAGDPNQPDLEQVVLAADRAAELTRQLLAFSRRQVLQPRVIDPADVVLGIAPLLRRLLGEHIELVTHAPPGLGQVLVDPSQLEQVVVNLAVNARDAMPAGGKLAIEIVNAQLDAAYAALHPGVTPGPHLGLVISDTGTGMDEATKARIFEPFFTTKEPGKGTGMGLATVYGIVKQSGGSIYVYSEPGHGTSFKVYLPRVEGGAARAPDPTAAEVQPRGREVVLLVEDEAAVRSFAARILDARGYTVLQAANGAEALAVAAAHQGPIDLLLTDVIMPGLQGHQLALQLATSRPGLRVLYVSGFTENSVVHHGVVGEGIAFLPKPFSGEALGRAVRQALDQRP